MLFVGDDWAEDHHDVEVVDEAGKRLVKKRVPEGVAGLAQLHALIADHLSDDAQAGDVDITLTRLVRSNLLSSPLRQMPLDMTVSCGSSRERYR